MKKDDIALIVSKLRGSGKLQLFNGQLFINDKRRGWMPTNGREDFHFYTDVLAKMAPDLLDGDITTIIKSLQSTLRPKPLGNKTTITTPTQEIDVVTGTLGKRTNNDIALSVPLDYNSTAVCPQWWDDALNFALPDKESQDAYYEALGLSMITDKKFEVSYWFTGEGGTGKSTIILAVINGLHYRYNMTSLEPDQWKSDNPSFYTMANKLVNISSDSTDNKRLETGIFKKLASGEQVNANIKYYAPIDFDNTALLISIGNDMPIITEKSDGPFRRMIPIDFDVKVDKATKNINIKDEISANKDGVLDYIMKRAVEAVIKIYRRGYPTMPAKATKSLDKIKDDNSVIRQFLRDEENIKSVEAYETGTDGHGMKYSDAVIKINEWASRNGYSKQTRNNIFTQLNKELPLAEIFDLYVRHNVKYIVTTKVEEGQQ